MRLSRAAAACLAMLLCFCFGRCALAQQHAERAAVAAPGDIGGADGYVGEYRSKHFLIHTDLHPEAAQALQDRLEATLKVIARYWGRPSRGRIECYVVQDLDAWPDAALPHPLARVLIGGVGGGTVVRTQRIGKRTTAIAEVYASSRPGIAEHEAVHAYCNQAFGATGPDWYKEGMAEMAYYHRHGERELRLPADVRTSLKQAAPRTLEEIVNRGRFTRKLAHSVDAILANHESSVETSRSVPPPRHVPLEAWSEEHDKTAKTARESYLWSWALCHLLCENPNYADRFRALGVGYLAGQNASFEQAFGPVAREIRFEYDLFLKQIDDGYRVDLCAWEWNKQFLSAAQRRLTSVRVKAMRGFQASGLQVVAGERFNYAATGSWSLAEGAEAVTADGGADGQGRLVGVLLDEYQLGEPFDLGSRGSFTAPADGKLYLRCRDDWHSLADNQGAVNVCMDRLGKAPEAHARTAPAGK